jgi:IS5 family transposase
VTAREGVVVGMRSMPCNPYDGHTAAEQIEQVAILTGERPKTVLADRGYKGAQIPGCRLLLAHTRKLPERLQRLLKRRNAIEPTIGHMKNDGLLRRNWLKGSLGDAMHAVLCGAGHNLRLNLAHLRVLYFAWFGFAALAMLALSSPPKITELQLGRAN